MAAADGGQAERAVPSLCPRAPPGPGRARASPALQSSASAGAGPETWPPPTTGCPHHETPALTQRAKARYHQHFYCGHLEDFFVADAQKYFHNISKSFFGQVLIQNCRSIDQKGCLFCLIWTRCYNCPLSTCNLRGGGVDSRGVECSPDSPGRVLPLCSVVPGVARDWRLRAP